MNAYFRFWVVTSWERVTLTSATHWNLRSESASKDFRKFDYLLEEEAASETIQAEDSNMLGKTILPAIGDGSNRLNCWNYSGDYKVELSCACEDFPLLRGNRRVAIWVSEMVHDAN
jgi:hypothetical protein